MKRAHTFPAFASAAMLSMYMVAIGLLGLPATGIAAAGDTLTCSMEVSESTLRYIPVLHGYDPTASSVRLTAVNNTGMNLSDLSFAIEWTDPSGLDLLELDPGAPDNERSRTRAVLLAGANLDMQWALRLRAPNTTGGIVRIPFTVRYSARELGNPLIPFATAVVEIWPVTSPILQCTLTAPDSIRFHDGAYDPAEFDVELLVENTGSEQARNVRAFLLQSSGFTAVSTATRDLGDIDAGAVVTLKGAEAFRLRPNTRAVSGFDTLRVMVSGEGSSVEQIFPVWIAHAAQPRLELTCDWNGTLLFDPNINDYQPNPIIVPVRVRNTGDAAADNVALSVTASAGIVPYQGIGSVEAGTLQPGEEFSVDWRMEVLRRDVPGDERLEFTAEGEGGPGGTALRSSCQTAITVPPVLKAELVCESQVEEVRFDPQKGRYVPDPFSYRVRVSNVGTLPASVHARILLPPGLQLGPGGGGGQQPFPDTLQPGETSPWLEWKLSIAGLFTTGDSLSICTRIYDVYNNEAICCDRSWIPPYPDPGSQLTCDTELEQREFDVQTGRYVQDHFKVTLKVSNTSGRSVFDVNATALSFDPGLRLAGSGSQHLADRFDSNAPPIFAEWDVIAAPHDSAAVAEIRFLVSARDELGNVLPTRECVVQIRIPAMPRPSMSCAVETDVTDPPQDVTIAWDLEAVSYEGQPSAFGEYTVITVTATVTNTGAGTAQHLRGTLLLPENMTLDNAETAIKLLEPADVAPGESASISWKVYVIGQCQRPEQRSLEVLVTGDNTDILRCAITVEVAAKPCGVNLDLADDVLGATEQIVVAPIFFDDRAAEPLTRYRLMIRFDPALITFQDAVAEGSRTAEGWRGPRAEVFPDPERADRAILLVDDMTLNAGKGIRFGEQGTLVFLRFEVTYDPEFLMSSQWNVMQGDLEFIDAATLAGGRDVVSAFNAPAEDQRASVFNIYGRGMVTVTSPCAWPLQWEAHLEGNRPNPFNPSTVIRYALDAPMPVRLVVLDIFGREIRELDRGLRTAGAHDVAFDAEDLPGGVYFYQLRTPAGVKTRRMLLLR